MKHEDVNNLLRNPDDLLAENIAQYAIFNTTDNDNTKFNNIVELIVAYTSSMTRMHAKRYIKQISELNSSAKTNED